ncbi:Ribonuclease H [Candidatus Hydrogenisulfobacillus filiaventi]|uniref:Ribonuclease H n=1 Tax=Candidatus Hydrogenisulfobacillus filiaventi TaxID=2707344 RepID=A0A6F8ZEZ3_9FIRM|nr:ribonuclease HI [Bacillota bacterium]CAB1128203.1 Ribonuclease H [Candidatus Hydrogenisulfobacillus filiaventi]
MTGRVIEVYTDGACRNNQAPGGQPGGWGVVFADGREYAGAEAATTNNRMELTAAIEALRRTEPGARVRVYSDSAYLVNAFRQNWFRGWEQRGWRNARGQPVENQDLWRELLRLAGEREVEWVKVAGHRGHPLNERADRLATAAADGLRTSGRGSGPGPR